MRTAPRNARVTNDRTNVRRRTDPAFGSVTDGFVGDGIALLLAERKDAGTVATVVVLRVGCVSLDRTASPTILRSCQQFHRDNAVTRLVMTLMVHE